MTDKERCIQDNLRCWSDIYKRIDKLENELGQIEFSITSNYEITGIKGGTVSSKIERYCIQRMNKEAELKKLYDIVERYNKAISCGGLTKREKELVNLMKSDVPLSWYARKNDIYLSYIYKIKDSALRKIADYLEEEDKKNTAKRKNFRVKC